MRRNSGKEKKVQIGSLAGPESPRPCSHNKKLRFRVAMIPRFSWSGTRGGCAQRRREATRWEVAAMAAPREKSKQHLVVSILPVLRALT